MVVLGVLARRASPLAVMDRRSGDAESFWTGSYSRLAGIRGLDVEVRDNGTVKVVLVEGDKSHSVASLLGEHKLW